MDGIQATIWASRATTDLHPKGLSTDGHRPNQPDPHLAETAT